MSRCKCRAFVTDLRERMKDLVCFLAWRKVGVLTCIKMEEQRG
jgi:hypothetical protein